MELKDLYTMKLHNTTWENSQKKDMFITRVPGGWLYRLYSNAKGLYLEPVYVPQDDNTFKAFARTGEDK